MWSKQVSRQRKTPAHRAQGESEPTAKQPGREPVPDDTRDPERPFTPFVESETLKYWQEMVKSARLVKPEREQLRETAMPILVQGLRRRTGRKKYVDPSMARRAVADVVQYASEQQWVMLYPRAKAYASPFHIDALLQLAMDADWYPKEIPLPRHPGPQHPAIFYCDEMLRVGDVYPVPRPDALIRGDYVCTDGGRRITSLDHIRPWPVRNQSPYLTGLIDLELDACYELKCRGSAVWAHVYWIETCWEGLEMHQARLEDLPFQKTTSAADDSSDCFSLAPSEEVAQTGNPCAAVTRYCFALVRQARFALRFFPALRRLP